MTTDMPDLEKENRIVTANLGYPRIGRDRSLKKATEKFWKREITETELETVGRGIKKENWQAQEKSGIDIIPSNDFSFYDQVLDMATLVGAIPDRFSCIGEGAELNSYFAMARGGGEKKGNDLVPVHGLEMKKWFDTNYHFFVPEFEKNMGFTLTSDRPMRQFHEAINCGIKTRPVLIGPVTFLHLGKCVGELFNKFDLLDSLLPVYVELLKKLKNSGVGWIQMDEPVLCLDQDNKRTEALRKTYETFAREAPELDLMLTSYFGSLGRNISFATRLPVAGLHIDLVRAPEQIDDVLSDFPANKILSLGVIDGRNIWRSDLEKILRTLLPVVDSSNISSLIIAPSSSLIHVPLDLDSETELDPELTQSLAFAKQKIGELKILRDALNLGRTATAKELAENRAALELRLKWRHGPKKPVKRGKAMTQEQDWFRKSPYEERNKVQNITLKLPMFPTTTIGSFPQTDDIRKTRARKKRGEISADQYEIFLKEKIQEAISRQEEIGLDVLTHGEFERNDMVEYFGEKLEGFAFTKNGWVQSFGSRYVKPPIIFSDVFRTGPMTVKWFVYAQSLTNQIVKGMLTGPVTILQWSFVRDDLPRHETALQIAHAIREEVLDLEEAGAGIIQIDEPAFREGLPLAEKEREKYLKWAVQAFKVASGGVSDATQIHTHMCYSEFKEIFDAITALDVDVLSVESSRAQRDMVKSYKEFKYSNGMGPGVYDIHSPRVPGKKEIQKILQKACEVFLMEKIWVNPDCGLKTRSWAEITPALSNMVEAAKEMRKLKH